MNRLLAIVLTTFSLALSACDSTSPEGNPVVGVLVANQGNFSDGNGSVTGYDVESGTSSTLISGLSSIIQSIYVHNGKIYVLSNTANRIDVYDAATNSQVGQITGVVSPRYMLAVSDTKAYVTNLYKANFSGGTISVIDLTANAVVSTIDVGDHPEEIAQVGPNLFVANWGFGAGSTISIISTTSDSLLSTVDVNCQGPRSLHVDQDANVATFCTGQIIYNSDFTQIIETTPGAISTVDGATGDLLSTVRLSSQISTAGPGQQTTLAEDGREVYVALEDQSIIRYRLATNTVLGSFGPLPGDPISAIAWDDVEERLYVGRTPSFVDAGEVTIHDDSGSELSSFATGVAPSHILFLREN